MLSRRDVVKLGAAGLVAPTISGFIAPWVPAAQHKQETPSKAAAARGPSLDRPIVVKWRFEKPGTIYSPPSIANGAVYLSSQGNNLQALDVVSGRELWTFTQEGMPSRPILADGIVITSSNDRTVSSLYAINTTSGQELWHLAPDVIFYTTPAVASGVVFVGAGDGNLYALDARSGEERWRKPEIFPAWLSTPTVENGIVYIGSSDHNLYAIDAESGQEHWRLTTGDTVALEPVVADGVVYAGSEDKHLYAIDAVSGIERWRVNACVKGATPAVADGMIYIGSKDPDLHARDVTSGEEQWRLTWGDLVSSLAVADGIVYAGGYDNLLAIDATSGQEFWRFTTGIDFNGGGVVAVADGVVYAVHEGSNLVAIGNLDVAVLGQDVVLRGAPGSSGIERSTAGIGDAIDRVGATEERDGQTWAEVTIGDVTGWIPLDAIDPATLPPEGEIEYVYVPN